MNQYSLTKHRTFQWIAIIVVLFGIVGIYFYYRSHAAQTITDNRPSFEAPLITDLNLTRGIGSATYSRADGADRRATVTDFEGLIRPVKNGEARFEGARRVENLATYSEDFSNSVWNASIADPPTVTTNAITAPDGTLTADRITNITNTHRILAQSIANANPGGNTFTFSFWIKGTITSATTVKLALMDTSGNWPANMVKSTDIKGTYNSWTRLSFTGTVGNTSPSTTLQANIGQPDGTANYAGSDFYIWGAQVESVSSQANQNPSEYISTNVRTAFPYHGAGVDGVKYFATQNGNTVASNVVTEATGAAIPDATLKGYLAEGTRTNLIIHSEIDSWWVASGTGGTTLTNNAVIAPSGKTTAASVLASDTSSGVRSAHVGANATVSASTAYAVSAYVKASGENFAFIQVNNQDSLVASVAYFNLTTGATATADLGVGFTNKSATATAVANGWWRIAFMLTADVSSTGLGLYIGPTASISSRTYVGTVGNGIDLWGTQIEVGLYASSYIPTTTASVTRARDNLKYIGASNFNDTAGTVSVDVTPNWSVGNGQSARFIDDSATARRIMLWHWSGQDNHLAVDRDGNGGVRNVYDYVGSTITTGTQMRLAQRWISTPSASDSLFRDGSLRGSRTTSMTLPYDALSGISVGQGADLSSEAFSTLKNVRAWKTAMSDTFINNLTSLTQATSDAATKKTTVKIPNKNGLIGYWSFEDGTGIQATDFSGNNNTGTLTNFALSGTTSNWVDGKFGKAVNLDGINDYVRVSTLDNANFPTNGTLSFWIKADFNQSFKPIFDNYDGTRNHIFVRTENIAGGCASGDGIQIAFQPGDGSGYKFAKNVCALSANTWIYVTVIWDTTNDVGSVYLNGSLMSSGTSAISDAAWTPNQENMYVGGAGGSSFNGSLDDIRLYNRVLTATEVANLYQQSAVAKVNVSENSMLTSGLIGLWSFNGPDVSGITAYDRSGSGNNGTLTLGPTVVPGKVGQALRFDGVDDYVTIGSKTAYDVGIGQAATISAWIKAGTQSATKYFLWKAGGCIGWDFYMTTAGQINLMFTTGNTTCTGYNTYQSQATGNFGDNTWHHVVGVINRPSNTMYMYIDGAANGNVATPDNSYNANTNPDFRIGTLWDNSAPFAGSIDEVRFYNRALSATEISSLYNLGR